MLLLHGHVVVMTCLLLSLSQGLSGLIELLGGGGLPGRLGGEDWKPLLVDVALEHVALGLPQGLLPLPLIQILAKNDPLTLSKEGGLEEPLILVNPSQDPGIQLFQGEGGDHVLPQDLKFL
jgi:hypothetical protein